MKRIRVTPLRSILCGLMISAVIASVPQPAVAEGRNPDFVTFFESPGYRGASFSVESAGEISNLGSRQLDFFSSLSGFSTRRRVTWDNVISSIQFNGAFEVTVYRDRNFAGPSATFRVSQRTIRAVGVEALDNQISSIQWQPLNEGQGQPRIVFFNRPDFQGDSFLLYPGDNIARLETKRRNSRRKDWSDEIRSVRVIGDDMRVILYEDKEYRGRRVTIRSDAPTLLPIGFSASASSLKVLGSGRDFNSNR